MVEFIMHVCRTALDDWDDIHGLANAMPHHVFRGHADHSWPLSTSLERCLARRQPRIPFQQHHEYWMLHEFKRKYRLYAGHAPAQDDTVEWLALMQHNGCPTRMLDFSYSPYVAAFFALVDVVDNAAVWCIDWTALRDAAYVRFGLEYVKGKDLRDVVNVYHIDLLNSLMAKSDNNAFPSAIPIEPKALTERIARQQGLFVVPTRTDIAFVENLRGSLSLDPVEECASISSLKNAEPHDHPVVKVEIPNSVAKQGMKQLLKMNITSESLFPGLEGLARSLIRSMITY